MPLDSLLPSWGAFGGVLAAPVVWSIVVSNVLVKGATTLLSLPLIYASLPSPSGRDAVRPGGRPRVSLAPGQRTEYRNGGVPTV